MAGLKKSHKSKSDVVLTYLLNTRIHDELDPSIQELDLGFYAQHREYILRTGHTSKRQGHRTTTTCSLLHSRVQATPRTVKTRITLHLSTKELQRLTRLNSLHTTTTTMPSFLKKLLLGKDLSNPYVNKYHVGHRAIPQPTQHATTYAAQSIDPHPTGLTLSTRIPPRPASPTYLEEARRLAGRDPVTGRALSVEQGARDLQGSEETIQARQAAWGQQQPSTSRMQQDRTVGVDFQQERHDVTVRDERRRRLEEESAAAERLRQREVGGYFAPERSVREYYSGS